MQHKVENFRIVTKSSITAAKNSTDIFVQSFISSDILSFALLCQIGKNKSQLFSD